LVPRRREDDSLEGHSSIGTKFAAQDVCYGINDTIKINATAFSDLVDQRIAINQPSREQLDVWDLLFQTDDQPRPLPKPRLWNRLRSATNTLRIASQSERRPRPSTVA
jgi:hypothetical protein